MTGWARQQDKIVLWDKRGEQDWLENGLKQEPRAEAERNRKDKGFFKGLKEHWAYKNNAGAMLLCVKSLQITQ